MTKVQLVRERDKLPFFQYHDKKVYYRDEGKGKVLLLLPGNTASSAVHLSEIKFFSESFRVICPDYVGYGQSDRVERLPVDFWWVTAEMCMDLVQSLNVDDFIAIGTSGGGIIALDAAIIAPNFVKCVVADSIPGEFLNREQLQREVKKRESLTEDSIEFWKNAHGQDWNRVVQMDSRLILEIAEVENSLFKDRLSEVKCPVLLTGSLMDDAIPNIELEICSIAKKISTSKTVLFPAGGHPLMWSRPNDFRKEVVSFVSGVK